MNAASRLGLGTVQFGLDYGVTNPAGQVTQQEIGAILKRASAAGIDTLDTARLYGESEAAIGRSGRADSFRIVTKTPKFAEVSSGDAAAALLNDDLSHSLAALGCERVEALLVHDADDLTGPHGPAIWEAMQAAKAAGRVGKIGVSVYRGEQVDAVLDRFAIEIVQLPFNPLDRRLIEAGQLARLKDARVEVHARSLFLQGLLLQAPEAIEPRFGALREAVAELHGWAAGEEMTPLQGVLALALAEARIDRFIIGITSVAELEDIVSAAQIRQGVQPQADFVSSVALDARHLDPSRWGELGQA